MKKEKNEFSGLLDEVESKVSQINDKKKRTIAREKKVMKILERRDQIKKEEKLEEEKFVKESNTKINLQIYLTGFALVGVILYYLYDRIDPVDFWFGIIVIVISGGKMLIRRKKG